MRFLTILSFIILSACHYNKAMQEPVQQTQSQVKKIVMQRVIDTEPLDKQDLVNRQAMQLALLEKIEKREKEQEEKFLKISQQQRNDFIKAHKENVDELELISKDMSLTEEKIALNTDIMVEESKKFNMTVSKVQKDLKSQSMFFDDMADTYEEKLAFDKELLEREKEKENTIRGVVENMYEDQDTALRSFYQANKEGMLPPSEWVNLDEAKVTLHTENEKFEDLLLRALNKASIHAGPWVLKWKLKKENEILLYTRFNIDAEMSFGELVSNIKKYILNYNGVSLQFRVFKEKRILIVSDT